MTAEQKTAIQKVAVSYGWHEMTTSDLGLLLWCLFRYYVMRLPMTTTALKSQN